MLKNVKIPGNTAACHRSLPASRGERLRQPVYLEGTECVNGGHIEGAKQ